MNNHHTLFDLSGHIALVTGASKGMGRAIAAILAQAGAKVVFSSRRQEDCDQVAEEISPQPGQCIGVASDIGVKKTLEALVSTTQAKIGHPDILVCNAAGGAPNAIAPTVVRTEFSRSLWEAPEALERATARVPMSRVGEPDDVAGLALLVASPAGSFINGQVIGADGGASAW